MWPCDSNKISNVSLCRKSLVYIVIPVELYVDVLQTCTILSVKNMSVALSFIICTMTSEQTPQQSGPLVSS